MLLFLFALQQPPAQQQPTTPPPVLKVVVSPANPTVMAGDSIRLTAVVKDAQGNTVPNARVRWFGGSFEGRVDSTGMVRAGARGTLVIRAVPSIEGSAPGAPTTVHIRMTSAAPATIELTPSPVRVLPNQRVALTAVVRSANGDVGDDFVAWKSSAPNIARVGSDGVIQAVAPGTTTITGTAGKASNSVTVTVLGAKVGHVEVTANNNKVRTGDVVRVNAVAHNAAGAAITGVNPTWSVAPGSAEITTEGRFVAAQPGVYTVTATYGATSGSATVQVSTRDVMRPTVTVSRVALAMPAAEFWPHPNGQHAYLTTIGSKLFTLDISNTAKPTIIDSLVIDARTINDVQTTPDGKLGVVTREGASSRRNGIVILDLADAGHPKVLSEFTETVTGGVHSVFTYQSPKFGTYVFITDDATGSLRTIDLNDPTKPKEVARWQTQRGAGRILHDLDIRDGFAYLSYWNDGLVILDIGNGLKGGTPTKPELVSQYVYDLEALYRDVEVEGGPGYIRGTHTAWRSGKYVFVGDEVFTAKPIGVKMPGMGLGKANGRLHVIDVSDITKPKEVAWYEPKDGGSHNVWVAGDTLYMGDYQGGLRVLDISGELMGDLLAQGREIAHVHTGDAQGFVPNASMAWGAFYHKGLVWVPDIFSGLWAIRVEQRPPTRPVIP
ncbi:MAG TPA: Ig-like domain-containing protein [Longimicrobiales bacterium]|nr:Ig-like domain-containing protein [Longimicrobiales bacterium]